MSQPPFHGNRRSFFRVAAAGAAGLVAARLALPERAFGQESIEVGDAESDSGGIPLQIPRDLYAGEQWVDVNLTYQVAVAMIGGAWSHMAYVTTGRDGWETPPGQFRIVRRVANETMTSASLGIDDPNDYYVLTDVLFTQYFTWEGHALHLNYWQPESVFGAERTSHGCVGMRYDDAAYFWNHLQMGSRVVIHA